MWNKLEICDRVGPTFGSSSNISNDCSSSNLFDVSYHNDAPVQLGLDQTNEQHAIEISTLELDDECNQSQSCYRTSNNEYDDIYSSENDDTESNDPDIDILTYHQTLKNLGQRKQLMAISLSKLKADGNLTETSLPTIQEWAEGLIEESVRTVIGGVKLYCKEISTKLNEVFILGLGLCNPFHGVKHEVQRKKCLPYFVQPKRYILYKSPDEFSSQSYECCTMEYVPLLDLLQTLLENSCLFQNLQKRDPITTAANTELLERFEHGEYAKQHPLFGGIYILVLNTDAKWKSGLNRIFLSTMFYTKHLKHPEIGWKKILQPLNDDIRLLETVL